MICGALRIVTVGVAMLGCGGDSGGGAPDADLTPDAYVQPDATGDRGIVRVFWNVDQGMRTCAEAGATRVTVTMTRDRDGLEVSGDFDCEARVGVLPTVPMDGIYAIHGQLENADGVALDEADENLQFDTCDSTIVTPDGTVCGRELLPWDFRTP